ncbi:polysaccharide deacetylase family protein [Streptomyces sp. CA-253872]|uniref:polysaccharide deacetylase family protein n=1 Tax=Streptomyces sp. CA-253872 TaxID=3240067 RepID=UPI003D8A0037
MYHAIDPDPPAATRRLSVTPDAFATQMALLAGAGMTPVTAARLGEAWRGEGELPGRPVLVTFDDGYAGVHTYALPVLVSYGFGATLFATTGWLRGRGGQPGGAPGPMLDWPRLAELAAEGVEIGGHTHTHPHLDQLTGAALRAEVRRDAELLGERLGTRPVSFAYPFGHADRRVRREVRAAGWRQALAVGNGLARRRQGPYALERLTVRRRTGPDEFARLVEGRGLLRAYAGDRALTRGYGLVRALRRSTRKAR